jgi:hypothetical protein
VGRRLPIRPSSNRQLVDRIIIPISPASSTIATLRRPRPSFPPALHAPRSTTHRSVDTSAINYSFAVKFVPLAFSHHHSPVLPPALGDRAKREDLRRLAQPSGAGAGGGGKSAVPAEGAQPLAGRLAEGPARRVQSHYSGRSFKEVSYGLT